MSSQISGNQIQNVTSTYAVSPLFTFSPGYWLVIGQVQITATSTYNDNGHSNAYFRINFASSPPVSTQNSGTITNTNVNSVSSYVGLCRGSPLASYLHLSELINIPTSANTQEFVVYTGDLHDGTNVNNYLIMTFQAILIS
jgi:hypothetical protein